MGFTAYLLSILSPSCFPSVFRIVDSQVRAFSLAATLGLLLPSLGDFLDISSTPELLLRQVDVKSLNVAEQERVYYFVTPWWQ